MDRATIAAVELGLAEAGMSVAALCRRADIAQTTWQRLKGGNIAAMRQATEARLRDAYVALTGNPWPGPAAKQDAA